MIVPYYTKAMTSHAGMHPEVMPADARCFEVENPAHRGFFDALLAANHQAFSGPLVLPSWVMLDCYLLPSAVVGFCDGEIPISAYTALPSAEPGNWIGVSLFSLVKGYGLKTKTLALQYYGAKKQSGIAQFNNASLRVHSQLGPMRLLSCGPPLHALSDMTFIYEIDLQQNATHKGEWYSLADAAAMGTLKKNINAHPGRYAIVAPGLRESEILVADLQ